MKIAPPFRIDRSRSTPHAMHLIRRPKKGNPFAWHYGISVETLPNGVQVYDLQCGRGFRQRSIQEFGDGMRSETVLSHFDTDAVASAWDRLTRLFTSPELDKYSLVGRNCEHVARYVITGAWNSQQVDVGAAVCGLGLVFLASRSGN